MNQNANLTIDKQKAFGLKSEPRATGTPAKKETEMELLKMSNMKVKKREASGLRVKGQFEYTAIRIGGNLDKGPNRFHHGCRDRGLE